MQSKLILLTLGNIETILKFPPCKNIPRRDCRNIAVQYLIKLNYVNKVKVKR